MYISIQGDYMVGDNNPFPHDGKQGRCGCGQGYSWNDDNYGRHRIAWSVDTYCCWILFVYE